MRRPKKSGLKSYRAKRRFGITAEPKGAVARTRGNAYVIQKHAARRLHYDLRLELDGVMKSWAVTRGPSLVPGEKQLAVQVEDHPIAYNKFEGIIPQGEYGGGTVMIWDLGRWRPENDPHEGLAKGHLSFTLEGAKLKGGWHLVRMHRRRGEKRDNWLLIKQKDGAARSARERDILEDRPLSAATGRTLEEIAGDPKKVWRSNKSRAVDKPKPRPRKRARAAEIRPMRKSDRSKFDALPGARRATLPAFVAPSLATLADKPPAGGNWVHEIKFDGYRMQARIDHGKVKLLTRKGLDWAARFPSIASAIAELPVESAIVDGEIVSEGSDGISSFSLLQQDLKSGRPDRMAFYVFDLLHLDSADLRPLPLTARKNTLTHLLERLPDRSPIRLSKSLTEPGPTLLHHACKMGLEGIISKMADAPYRSGRGRNWIKSKCSDRQELVVAGVAPSTVDHRAVGALVLGFYDKGKLRYAGRTGTGFTHETARTLFRKLMTLRTDRAPFKAIPAEERGARKPIWVTPEMVVEVNFHGWTHGDRIRQASFQGVREDKTAKDVVREHTKSLAALNKDATAKRRSGPVIARNSKFAVGDIVLTHPDRVYWPDSNITKRELAEFYTKIWKWMRPHLVGRPIALLRCPEGASGECFFQKHATMGVSTEHLHLVPEKGDKIISIDDLNGLIALVQAGVLEIHTRGTTIERPGTRGSARIRSRPWPGNPLEGRRRRRA